MQPWSLGLVLPHRSAGHGEIPVGSRNLALHDLVMDFMDVFV